MEILVNRLIKTSTVKDTYTVKLVVEDVPNLPLDVEIKSNFCFGDSKWIISLTKYSWVELKLIRGISATSLQIDSEVKLLDCNGKVYFENTVKEYHSDLHEDLTLTFSDIAPTVLDEFKSAPDDTWYFIFIIRTYEIHEKISDYGIPSQEICEEKTKNSFCANIRKMLEHKIGTDVTLQVNDDKIEAHKLVLSAQSPVFARMFEIPMSESEKNTVVIKDISKAAMTKLIHYMYSKIEIECSFEIAMELYYAADKYEVFDLRELCGKILISLLTEDNTGMVLEMANKHKDDSLKSKVMEFINSNIKFCIKKEWWYELVGKKTELVKELLNFIN